MLTRALRPGRRSTGRSGNRTRGSTLLEAEHLAGYLLWKISGGGNLPEGYGSPSKSFYDALVPPAFGGAWGRNEVTLFLTKVLWVACSWGQVPFLLGGKAAKGEEEK